MPLYSMLLLTGEYDLSLDEKNRLAIPSKIREQISPEEYGEGFYQVLGPSRILCLYPDKYFQHFALAVVPGKAAPDELLTIDRVNYSQANKVELDRQGRVLLTDKMLQRAGLKSQVTLIGARDHLEVWDQKRWEAYLSEHFSSHEQSMLMARQAMIESEREKMKRQDEMEQGSEVVTRKGK